MSETKKILVVEDNADLASLIQLHLHDLHAEADIAKDGGLAVQLFNQQHYDLVILDLMLPVLDGISVCKKIRETSSTVPIVILTAKNSELDRVLGLEIGADDYVTKPFSIPELMARIKARFRSIDAFNEHKNSAEPILQFKGLRLEHKKRLVYVDNRAVDLTVKEFELLAFFMRSPNQVFSRIQLLDKVWGYHYEGYEHTVNTHINRLRAKIETEAEKPKYIITVWGVGYKFSSEID
ncbi:MAG: response regulator transcription factor [Gammaproteobacteria bacterium]|nr:response regulator transcription factor [Gammaproteobacteria bacterium]